MQVLTKDPSVHWSSRQQKIVADRPLPIIKRLGFEQTRWGWFPWCPEAIKRLVHPFDVAIASRFVPGPRILTVNRCSQDAQYHLAHYGHLCFRIKPILWREVPDPGVQLGGLVEISSLNSSREPGLATVEEVFWDSTDEAIRFQLSSRGKILPDLFASTEFQVVGRPSLLSTAS